jgi:hypothetical protein
MPQHTTGLWTALSRALAAEAAAAEAASARSRLARLRLAPAPARLDDAAVAMGPDRPVLAPALTEVLTQVLEMADHGSVLTDPAIQGAAAQGPAADPDAGAVVLRFPSRPASAVADGPVAVVIDLSDARRRSGR